MQLVGLGFGVAVGTSIAAGWFGAASPVQPHSFGLETQVVAAAIAGLALVFIVPGVLMLVPGSLGYESAARLLADDTIEGIEGIFDTLVVALSIVYGLIVSTVLLPDRRASSSSRLGDLTS